MIKNIIFDFGQVLVHFEPSEMVKKYAPTPEDEKILSEVVFDRLYWDKLDEGTIADSEVISCIKKRLPERLWAVAEQCYFDWIYNIPEIDGMHTILQKLKSEHGIRLFLLSNISRYFAEHAQEIPILQEFEKCFFSAVHGIVKPNPAFFELLLTNCNLDATETLFVDDNPANVQAATSVGIKTYLFDKNVSAFEDFLTDLFSK